jgi:hypothetical protein
MDAIERIERGHGSPDRLSQTGHGIPRIRSSTWAVFVLTSLHEAFELVGGRVREDIKTWANAILD